MLSLRNPTTAGIGTLRTARVTIVDNDTRLNFGSSGYTVNENTATAVITVVREGGGSGITTVEATATSGTALSGVDFTGVTNTLVWASGDRSPKSFMVPIIDDLAIEPSETVSLTLRNPTGFTTLGSNSVTTLTIVENDFGPGIVGFETNAYFVAENALVGTVTLIRTNGSTGPVSVFIQTIDGTAKSGIDYFGTNGFVNFAEGQTNQIFRVSIIDDLAPEADETILLTLSNPGNGAGIGLASSTLLIKENEISNGTIIFSQTNYIVGEGDNFARITLIRTNGNQGRVSVNFNTVDGTANVDSDYLRFNATLTMEDTETNISFNIPILDDPREEPTELLNLQLSDPLGGVSIAQPHATLSITDDDFNPGYFEFTTNELSERSEFISYVALLQVSNGTNLVTISNSGFEFVPLTNVFFHGKMSMFNNRHAFDDSLSGVSPSGSPVGHHNPHGVVVTVARKGGTDGIATVDIRTKTRHGWCQICSAAIPIQR